MRKLPKKNCSFILQLIYKKMKNGNSGGFFCVVYFHDTRKTCYYRKVWSPAKLAAALQNWKWIKVFIEKQTYFANTQTQDYYCIFDENHPVREFTYKPFTRK